MFQKYLNNNPESGVVLCMAKDSDKGLIAGGKLAFILYALMLSEITNCCTFTLSLIMQAYGQSAEYFTDGKD